MTDGQRDHVGVLGYRPKVPDDLVREHSPHALAAFWLSVLIAVLMFAGLLPLGPLRWACWVLVATFHALLPFLACGGIFQRQYRRRLAVVALLVVAGAWLVTVLMVTR